jgi:hypothetical protein
MITKFVSRSPPKKIKNKFIFFLHAHVDLLILGIVKNVVSLDPKSGRTGGGTPRVGDQALP